MSKAIVTIPNKPSDNPYGFIPTGTDQWVQVIQVSVCTVDGEEEFLIANTYPNPFSQTLSKTLMEGVSKSKTHQAIGFLVADGEGWVHIKTEDGEYNSFALAAAAAVYKASLGWDESSSIIVRVNEAELSLLPRFDGNHWIVASLS